MRRVLRPAWLLLAAQRPAFGGRSQYRFGGGRGALSEHPATAADGDDRVVPEQATDAHEHAVTAALVQLGEARCTCEFTAPNDPLPVRVEHGQHSPLLTTLMHQGVRIEALSRSGAGHDMTVRPLGFATVWRM